MKLIPLVVLLMTVLMLSACVPAAAPTAAPVLQTHAVTQVNRSAPQQVTLPATGTDETQQVTEVVQGIGSKLQLVSLLSLTAAGDIKTQYGPYVSPSLLDQWAADPSQSPGRMTSSPWPDRIELTSMDKTSENEMVVHGNIIEVTSVELASGGAAATIPVEITLQKNDQGTWWITAWNQGQ